jgi:hypothetical protein
MDGGVTYLLPIKRSGAEANPPAELTAYLARIAARCQLVIVDGSGPAHFAAAHRVWAGLGEHLPPDDELTCRDCKVRGVMTGLRRARHERVVIADDDVRYDDVALERTVSLLDRAALVRPQNYFDALPWHARWDTARSLLNRAVGHDFPGTLAVRRSVLEATGGYDGDVLFENLELIRTVRAANGAIANPRDLFVARRPPSTRHFFTQRPRHAYDELARPHRLAAGALLAPLALMGWRHRAWRVLASGAIAAIGLAEIGRRRGGGRRVFPASSVLFAPLWLAERAVCTWIALAWRLTGGCPYHGARVVTAAHPRREIARRRVAGGARCGPPRARADAHPGDRVAVGGAGKGVGLDR